MCFQSTQAVADSSFVHSMKYWKWWDQCKFEEVKNILSQNFVRALFVFLAKFERLRLIVPILSSRLTVHPSQGLRKKICFITWTVDVARLNPSGVNPYFFQTLKKAACVRIAGSTSPAKTLILRSISNHLEYGLQSCSISFWYMSNPNLKSWPECLQTIE